jgi:hypothetical protein
MKLIAIPALISGLVAGSPSIAQSISESMPELAAHAPVVEQSAGVEYINGGASLEQRDAIAAVQSRFPLRVVLTGQGGQYIVADRLTVRDSNREVVAVQDAGPLVLLNLPPGRYTVEASYLGHTRSTSVQLGSAPHTLNWTLPGA